MLSSPGSTTTRCAMLALELADPVNARAKVTAVPSGVILRMTPFDEGPAGLLVATITLAPLSSATPLATSPYPEIVRLQICAPAGSNCLTTPYPDAPLTS